MNTKKMAQKKCVHKFTETALMKFRPIHYELPAPAASTRVGVVQKVSSMFTNLINHLSPKSFRSTGAVTPPKKFFSKSVQNSSQDKKSPDLKINGLKAVAVEEQNDRKTARRKTAQLQRRFNSHLELQEDESSKILNFLEKISVDTFLIGNHNQLDMITISGVYNGYVDTDLNWCLNIAKKIKNLAVDIKKGLIALESDNQILFYKYDIKKIKSQPLFINKAKLMGSPKFILFLKEAQLGVFYAQNATVYQIEENNAIRLIFNKKYGVGKQLELFQIPKPIQNTLNIFFQQHCPDSPTSILWRLILEFKDLSVTPGFKSLLRIYDIPNHLVDKFRIDNYSKDVFIMNFKFEILAAKDGYIIDSANTNIQEDGSCIVYSGEHLLHVTDTKLQIYSFKIITSSKPNKVNIKSVDSIDVNKNPEYSFFDCLEMLNGNFVLFFQINPQFNKKLKGEIAYIIIATQKLSIHEKLKQIFSFKSAEELKHLAQNQFSVIQQKCDTAFKIGLSRRQVYLQLWNVSNKSDIHDYKFLLDTMDYDTIKCQIQKKLKKTSMSFNEVYKLQQGCFDMLKTDLFTLNDCSQKTIKNYLISHFLLRKLAFFRDINLLNKLYTDQAKIFMIGIQQYHQCTKMQLKPFLLNYILKICFEQKDYTRQIRLFIHCFKFALRIIYLNILEDIIIQTKNKLIKFLMALPQILPYTHEQIPWGQDKGLYEGMWSEIEPQQWHKSMHIEQISTIYNRQCLLQFIKTIWFKRYEYTLHDLIALPKHKIIQIQQFNNSEAVFYYFIEKLFQHTSNQENLVEVVQFLELNYDKIPVHLKGKIFLYRKLYKYFLQQNCISCNLESFPTFLKLKDYEVFKELFKLEKIKKGCLLKDAKAIYNSVQNGHELYSQGILNYFASDLSQISDLKSIMNRLNNEKQQFHIQNEGIYELLVKAMQMKLKLGSDHDIPFDQVMIYFQNIPLSKNNPIIQQLSTVQQIGEESERFEKMKLNMSFRQIIERFEDVLTAMITEQIREKKVLQIRDIDQLKNVTYAILAEVQNVKEKIYREKMNSLTYFIYISKLMQEKEMIKYAQILLKDPSLLDFYLVDDKIIENLVIYMYRWKLTKEPAFVKNQQYLHQILHLLPPNNQYRIYYSAEIEFSIMLSTPEKPIEFRTYEESPEDNETKNQNLVTLEYIKQIVNDLPLNVLVNLDLDRLYELVKTMQELAFLQDNYLRLTILIDLYEVMILRLIELKDIRHALPLIRKLIEQYGQQQNYSIVFCFIILNILFAEIADNHKKNMFKIAFYSFNSPLQLLHIIQQRIDNKFSNDEEAAFINQQLDNLKTNKCYNKNNFLIEKQFVDKINQKQEKYSHKFEQLIFETWLHLNSNRQDFSKNFEYTFVYICLLHNPYALSKYLLIRHESINIRILRSYLSYVFKEQIFSGINVLYFSKRMFITILDSILEKVLIQLVISQYKGVELCEDIVEIPQISENNVFAIKLQKSIEAFSKKLQSLRNKQPTADQTQQKKKRVHALLSSEVSIRDATVSQYPFNDSDDNYQDQKEDSNKIVVQVHKVKKQRVFDANKQRANLLSGDRGGILSMTCAALDIGQIRRTHSSKHQHSRSFEKGFNSLRITNLLQRKKSGKSPSNSTHKEPDSPYIDQTERVRESNTGREIQFQRDQQLIVSQTQEDFLVSSALPTYDRPPQLSLDVLTLTNNKQKIDFIQFCDSPITVDLPKKIALFGSEDGRNFEDLYEYEDEVQLNVKINSVDDQQFTPVEVVKKKLLQEYGDDENQPMFNLYILENERNKQFEGFEEYLKQIISNVYQTPEKPLSLVLTLIKQIKNTYPYLAISNQFLENYILLQNYNIKYKYSLPIRQMFPIDGIFLQSKDPRVLFHFAKEHILSFVDFDNILIVARLLHFALKRSEIKDELYFAYLYSSIQQYGNDNESSQEDILMQKQRIGGIIDQITMPSLFLDKIHSLLHPITIQQRKQQVLQLVKEAFKKKKKEDLIPELHKRANQ